MADFILPEPGEPSAMRDAQWLKNQAFRRLNLRARHNNPNDAPLTEDELAELARLDAFFDGDGTEDMK